MPSKATNGEQKMEWFHIEQSIPEEGTTILVSDGEHLILTEAISIFDDDGHCYIDWEACESKDYPYFACPELPNKRPSENNPRRTL